MLKRILNSLFFIVLLSSTVKSQCPQVFDYLGNLSTRPYFISCTGSPNYSMNFASNASWGPYTINWGDGTPNQVGGSYTANTIINHVYNSATPDTFVITLTIPALNCTLTGIAVMEKPVNASIQIPIGGVTTACAPKALQFTNSSTDVSESTVFTWDFGDGSPQQTFDHNNAGQTVTHTYNPGTVNCQTAVTLRARNYCTPIPTIANFNPIQIYDIDDAAITPSAFIKCFPDNSFTFTNTTNRNCVPQGNTFQRQEWWNFGNYWGLGRDSIIDWRPWPPTTPVTITYPGVGNYTIQLRDSNLCGVDVVNVTVSIVNPPVAGVLSPTVPLCQGSAVTFTNTSVTGYSYRWNFGNGGGFVNRPFGPQTFTYTNPGTYTISVVALIPGAGNACTDTAKTVITILPAPIASFSVDPNVGCNTLDNVTFSDLSVSATAWNWNFGNGNTFTGQIPPTQSYTTVGNYVATLTVTAANTCVNTFTAPVRVFQKPTALFTPTIACVLSSTTFTDNSVHGIGDPIISWHWNFGDAIPTSTSTAQNPSHTYTNNNTYTVQLIVNTANCSDTINQALLVNIKPTADFSLTPLNGCPSLTVDFSNTSLNASNYNWDFGNGITSTSTNTNSIFTNTLSVNRIYTISLVATTPVGCSDTKTTTVTVFPKPVASFTSNAIVGCSPIASTFTNNSVGAASFLWKFGDANTSTSSAATVTHTYVNSTLLIQTYTAQLVVTSANGCKDSTTNLITVYPRPVFNFTMIPSSGCTPLSVNFPPVLGAVTYEWDFGDGSPLNFNPNPTHTFTNTTPFSQTFTVQLIATNAFSCVDTTYGYPVVFPKPTSNFSFTPNGGCSPANITFTNTSLSATTYTWNYGDGTGQVNFPNPTHTFTNNSLLPLTHTISLIASNTFSCSDTKTNTITILPKPVASFTTSTNAGCTPFNVIYTNNSSGATTYTWSYGDGSSNNNGFSATHTYTNNTPTNITYSTQLTASNSFGCKDSVVNFYTTYHKPLPSFTLAPNNGCAPLTVTLTNSSTQATNYQWNLGNGNTSSLVNVITTYTNSGVSNVTYSCTLVAITANNCRDSINQPITVFNKPVASFNVDTPACSPKVLNFSNTSIGGVSYEWDFGTITSTGINASHQFINNTNANITNTVQLIATSAGLCKDTIIVPIIIHPKLNIDIIANPDSGCTDLLVIFPAINNVVNYQWNFGDGNFSSIVNPSNTYVNTTLTNKTFTVQLIGSDGYGCKDTAFKVIKVFPKPTAFFQVNPNVVFVPSTPINCTNLSSNAISYFWNFGDNNTSVAVNPSHLYQTPGLYQIYLVATSANGCKDTFNLPSKIIAELESGIDVPNAFSPNPNGGNGGTFGPNDMNNDVFHPLIKGVDKYELNIFSRWGELLFVSKDINIGWDGYYKGKLCTQDVYIWKINASTIDGKKIDKTGDLLLLR